MDDEKNIVMYACGFVPAKLIKRYKKLKGSKYASFVECLMHMSVA